MSLLATANAHLTDVRLPTFPNLLMKLLRAATANPAGHAHVASILLAHIICLSQRSGSADFADQSDQVRLALEGK